MSVFTRVYKTLSSCNRRDASETGLHKVFRVISRMLEPGQDESAGIFVGDLIVHLIRQAGEDVAPVLSDLLRTLVFRLATAQTGTFSQVSFNPS